MVCAPWSGELKDELVMDDLPQLIDFLNDTLNDFNPRIQEDKDLFLNNLSPN